MRRLFNKNQAGAQEKKADTEQQTVLVVDDSPTEMHVIRGILEKGG
jgi:PleD family two-component response regulator